MEYEILKNERVILVEAIVESESLDGAFYKVTCEDERWKCTCASFRNRNQDCKHIKLIKEITQ